LAKAVKPFYNALSGSFFCGEGISLSIVRRRESAIGAWTRMLAMCVCLLCALGLAWGIAVAGGVGSAEAADDPVPTTTEPAPDPAPAPAPAPKPKPKPAPAPRPPVSQPQPTSVTPTPAPVVHSAPTKPAVTKRVVHKRKAHTKRKLHPKPSTSLPKIVTPKPARSGVLGTQTAATVSSGGSLNFGSLLIVGMLGIAIACFGVAAIPAVYVPWRPVAYFIAQRHQDMAIAGLGFLLLTGFLALVVGV
jgi:hypothetical protein